MMTVLANLLWPGLLAAAGLAIGAPAALNLLRDERLRTCRRVARALGLDRRQRRLIARLARESGIDGASLLISRGCFETAMSHPGAPARNRAKMEAIHRRIFGEEGLEPQVNSDAHR